jgi:hypothetical protein
MMRKFITGGDQMKSLLGKLGVILLVIGLTISVYVEVCRAQCGWVLWKKWDYQFGKDTERVSWDLMGAFPQYNECMKHQIDLFERLRIFWTDVTKRSPDKNEKVEASSGGGGPSQIIVRSKNDISIFEFYCLPDTIDPRK